MYIASVHHINDAHNFWLSAKTINFPGSVTLLENCQSLNGHYHHCLWEAESLSQLQAVMEDKLQAYGESRYYEVEEAEVSCNKH